MDARARELADLTTKGAGKDRTIPRRRTEVASGRSSVAERRCRVFGGDDSFSGWQCHVASTDRLVSVEAGVVASWSLSFSVRTVALRIRRVVCADDAVILRRWTVRNPGATELFSERPFGGGVDC